MREIVVVGGGFAGVWGAIGAARQLDEAGQGSDAVHVTLVSRDPWLTIRPRLHEAHPSEAMRVPLRAVLEPIGVTVVEATVDGIEPRARRLRGRVAGGGWSCPYDRLVLAAGSRLHRPPVPGLSACAWSVDTFDEALALESHLGALAAEAEGSGRLTAVVAGAGFTGVEVAAEMVGRLREVAGGQAQGVRVVLAERAPVLGPDLGEAPRPIIAEALAALGVEVRLGVAVEGVDPGEVVLSGGERIASRTVVWTAGLRASPLTAVLPAIQDALGRLEVDATLRVPGLPEVFAAGDVARAAIGEDHATLVSCQHAITLGVYAGHNAARDLLDLPLLPYVPLPYQTCLDLGAWGALYTRGWERAPVAVGAEAKAIKRTINTRWIYPPTSGDRREILAVATPGAYRRAT